MLRGVSRGIEVGTLDEVRTRVSQSVGAFGSVGRFRGGLPRLKVELGAFSWECIKLGEGVEAYIKVGRALLGGWVGSGVFYIEKVKLSEFARK